jgi:hypothetical protein
MNRVTLICSFADSDDERGFIAGIPPNFPSLKGLAKTAFPDKGRSDRRKQHGRHENPFQFRRRFSAMF